MIGFAFCMPVASILFLLPRERRTATFCLLHIFNLSLLCYKICGASIVLFCTEIHAVPHTFHRLCYAPKRLHQAIRCLHILPTTRQIVDLTPFPQASVSTKQFSGGGLVHGYPQLYVLAVWTHCLGSVPVNHVHTHTHNFVPLFLVIFFIRWSVWFSALFTFTVLAF